MIVNRAVIVFFFYCCCASKLETINGTGTLESTDFETLDSLLRNYDRRALPTSHLGIPTVVTCEIYIRSFGSINPETMDYEVDLYLQERWFDERLKEASGSRPLDLNDPELVKRIWKPEVFFPNAKSADFQLVTVPNVLVRINSGGEILYMLRLKLRFSCMMELSSYPMDSQMCSIELASFSKTTDELQLKWAETTPVNFYDHLKLPQFNIYKINTSLCKEKFHIGEYSCLLAEFYLHRSLGYHMVQSYLPTVLIVVVSWVSFWLDIEAIPARITLGVTTLLTISSKGSGIQNNLPPVSYVKAMDVWMGSCTTFVFLALMEFTFANYLWRKRIPKELLCISINKSNCQVSLTTAKLEETNVEKAIPASVACSYGSFAKRIDQLSRVIFPALFLTFNLAYWLYYLGYE
ncbi:glycine receptor subunit alpha-2-like [Tachypleus tridentatus]|uniref:glycine receptor subunit alpha-2-like n=1 Tax=Tachypleus tridentatus TaxID=6853 RepID=UPI003FCFA156